MQAQKDDERTRAQSAAGSRTWDSRDNVQNEEGGSAYISDRARAAVAKLSDTKFCLSVRMILEVNMPGYHAEVSEPGAGSPTLRRSFATLDGPLDWVMWRKVDNPDLIGRIETDDYITDHRQAMARLHHVSLAHRAKLPRSRLPREHHLNLADRYAEPPTALRRAVAKRRLHYVPGSRTGERLGQLEPSNTERHLRCPAEPLYASRPTAA
jgi:hypothetical protein